jgi:hypothetical protein
MSQSPPFAALRATLERADSDLAGGDAESASLAMAAAADICRDLHARGVQVNPQDIGPLREIAARCGTSLARLASALNAESLRDDNHRRALLTYRTFRPR